MSETNQSINKKIKEIIEEMTLEEKVSMLHGNGLFRTEAVERLGIPALTMSDGPMGVRKDYKNDKWEDLGNSYDYATYFPSNMALASTWNTDMAYEFGVSIGAEARARGKDVILGPGINIIRTPLCGRNFEYMSEDPYLISKMAVPFIKGVQTNDTAACVKHFAANNQEYERLNINVEMDDRALNEIYLPGFKAAVEEGNSYTIMGAYNKLRGEHCCESDYLINSVLRKQWNYDGVVISDWSAVHNTENAAKHGVDIEMSVTDNFNEYFLADPLIEKVKAGLIDEKFIDEKVERILKLMFKLNVFSEKRVRGSYNTLGHREVALNIARESIVLLKNQDSLLPLKDDKVKSLAVIGENADKQHSNGGGSAEIKALYEYTPLMGLKMRLGGNTKVQYAKGYSKDEALKAELLNEAVELAKSSDEVIIVVGLDHDFDVEGKDREDLTLPYNQDELVKAVLEVKPNAIVVNISGSPVGMEQWINEAKAVVHSFYAGMEGGYAIAEVLFGDVNPSGKLPVTFARSLSDSPAHCIGDFPGVETVEYKESIFVGYRYFDSKAVEPRFEFGYGLSYTEFKYSDLTLKVDNFEEINIELSFNITNTGRVSGDEIAQIYVSDLESSLIRPKKELKAFKKVFLEIGETKLVKVKLNKEALSFYNDKENKWVCEAGDFKVLVGSSSRDIKLERVFTI
ncbi:glycoside hydrolase family 3 C-terminal domain-containing protein [Clostridium sp. YIM B02505]|uniref:Glycoside hydrolase family 3 C-terminal domain-containing protein n=1 Tax=Clostridium yunnanense TaxID=2800325 RepID=A0ABS1ELF0_9CLOT|nr:glycoside hydrolase family 3 C-terminal domain-containing protein [Clostridium yunnanense]MBK1810183.1 glycoside hydrolase family 3 C-terminal domain-containing protein [Clostridium yunnanense]